MLLRRTIMALFCSGLAFVAVVAFGAQEAAVVEEAGTPEVLAEEPSATPSPTVEETAEPPEDPSVASEQSVEGEEATQVPEVAGNAPATDRPPPVAEEQVPEEAPVPEPMRGIVKVVVRGAGDEVRRTASGFVVQTNRVVTAAHVVEDEDHISVVVPSEGAQSPMLVARVDAVDEYADLALLFVSGLELEPLVLAHDGFDVERRVVSTGFWDTAEPESVPGVANTRGAVSEHDTLPPTRNDPEVALLLHNAMIPAAGYGGPVLNDCGEVVGVNRGSPKVSSRALRRGQAPQGFVYAAGVTAIVRLLQPAGVVLTRTESSCLDRVTVAEADAARASEERRQVEEDAARLAEEKEAEIAATEAERDQAREALEAADAAVADLERQVAEAERTGAGAESLRAELVEAEGNQEAARQKVVGLEGEIHALERVAEGLESQVERGRQTLAITIVIAVAAVLLLTVVGGVFYRRRSLELAYVRQQAVQGGDNAPGDRPAREADGVAGPGYLLTGETGDGNAVSLTVSGDMIASGVVIGRSPRNALLLIDDKTLSREHARLFAERDGVLIIEDLGTTNGTRVNGRRLQPRRGQSLRDGDTLQLGEVVLRLTQDV